MSPIFVVSGKKSLEAIIGSRFYRADGTTVSIPYFFPSIFFLLFLFFFFLLSLISLLSIQPFFLHIHYTRPLPHATLPPPSSLVPAPSPYAHHHCIHIFLLILYYTPFDILLVAPPSDPPPSPVLHGRLQRLPQPSSQPHLYLEATAPSDGSLIQDKRIASPSFLCSSLAIHPLHLPIRPSPASLL